MAVVLEVGMTDDKKRIAALEAELTKWQLEWDSPRQIDSVIRHKDAEIAELRGRLERYHDLVRYKRFDLHEDNLIDDEEYAALLSDGDSVARLCSYDNLRARIEELEASA